ncbi:MAG: hypothetical protein KGP28_03815 [Bdellovibrionales bacterium]|nr:hypothetical protein [Bdellovibrionales bacterium]
MMEFANLLFFLFTLIASIDAFYFHFFRFGLHKRPDCRREHLLHTWNACLLPFGAAPLLLGDSGGAVLWLAMLANLVTFGVESLDVLGEKKSREPLGGLPSAEYWMHFTMSGLRWAWVSLAAAAVPVSRWSDPWFWHPPSAWSPLSILNACILIGSVPVAFLHLYFAAFWSAKTKKS